MGLGMGLHQQRTEQDNPLSQMAADAGVDAPQDMVDILSLQSTQAPSTVLMS